MLRTNFLMRLVLDLCAILATSSAPSSSGSSSRGSVWLRDQERAAASLCNPHGASTGKHGATLLFLHVFKAAGSTTRETLHEYASKCHLPFKEAGHVCSRNSPNFLCLSSNGQVQTKAQAAVVQSTAVIAGHLWFGVHRVVKNVPVYITCLRRPLDTAISGRIYLHKKEMRALSNPAAAQFVRKLLASRHFQPTGFSKRLTGIEPRYRLDNDFRYRNGDSNISIYMNSNRSSSSSSNGSGSAMTFRGSKNAQSLDKAANQAIANLHMYFAAVGVVEHYPAFVDLLQRVLDPSRALSAAFWERQKFKHDNPSVKSTSTILKLIQENDPAFIANFNSSTLKPEWKIYGAAKAIFESMAQRHNVNIDQQKPAATAVVSSVANPRGGSSNSSSSSSSSSASFNSSSDTRSNRRDMRARVRMLENLSKKQKSFSIAARKARKPSLAEFSPLRLPGLAAKPSNHYSKAVDVALQSDIRSGRCS